MQIGFTRRRMCSDEVLRAPDRVSLPVTILRFCQTAKHHDRARPNGTRTRVRHEDAFHIRYGKVSSPPRWDTTKLGLLGNLEL